MERDASLTTTLFLGLRLENHTVLYFDPEIAGGRGFSGVDGLANSSNGELPRVASATPKPYVARLYVAHEFAFGTEVESFESDENQLGGRRPVNRYTITAGRFTLTDFFDNNRYSHDPRSQFMGWAVMYNGAWDYPADVRGYTWGWVHEVHTHSWSFRYASAAMPRVANGLRFDRRLLRNRGDVFEVERRWETRKHPGVVRLMNYENHANAGTYAEALRQAAAGGASTGHHRDPAQWNAEIRIRNQCRTGDHERGRRVCKTRLERRKDRELRLHGDRPAGDRGNIDQGKALAPALRYGSHGSDGGRDLGRPRALSGARRPRFPDRRRTLAVRSGDTFRNRTTTPVCCPGCSRPSICSTSRTRRTTRIADLSGSRRCGFTWSSGNPGELNTESVFHAQVTWPELM